MQISGLSASNNFSATDVLAIEVNVNGVEKTYKLTGATLAAALASIGSYLTTADVANIRSHGLTAKINVTLNGAGLVACGLLRFYHFYFTPTADIYAGTELIEGFTAPYLALNGGALGLAIEGTSRESCVIYLSPTGTLLCSSNLQNGKSYRCSLCYVSNTAV
jgi:hypothetical protein